MGADRLQGLPTHSHRIIAYPLHELKSDRSRPADCQLANNPETNLPESASQ